jgi:hypothetical protein
MSFDIEKAIGQQVIAIIRLEAGKCKNNTENKIIIHIIQIIHITVQTNHPT